MATISNPATARTSSVPVPPATASSSILMPTNEPSTSARVVGVSLLLGIAGTVLTYRHLLALGFTVYLVLFLGAMYLVARIQKVHPTRQSLFLSAVVLFFAAMFVLRSDESLVMLNLLFGAFAIMLLIYYFTSGSILQQDLFQHIARPFISGMAVFLQPFSELFQVRKWFSTHHTNWGALVPILRGAIITIPVVAIFVILLSSADNVFSDFVTNFLKAFTRFNGGELITQAVFVGFFAWTATGSLAFALLERKAKRAPSPGTQPILPIEEPNLDSIVTPAPIFSLGFTETVMMLGSVCAVFGLFVAIQFVYLFGGAHNIDVSKFNYSDYVHRGFSELIIVALLTLGLAYILNIVAIRRSTRQLHILRILLTVLIALTGVILVSAFQRLQLYEEVYGFTALRLLISVFIGWLGFLFAGFALSLYWQPATINVFGMATLVAAFGFAATLDVLNPDAFVAQQMIARNDVDPVYLVSLSDEAIPAMASLVDSPQPGLRQMVRNELWQRYGYNPFPPQIEDWRDFTLTSSAAYTALAPIKDKFKDSHALSYQADDFSSLKIGMSYREIVRQYGKPYYFFYNVSARDELVIEYAVSNQKDLVFLYIDTASGLTKACLGNTANSACQSVLK